MLLVLSLIVYLFLAASLYMLAKDQLYTDKGVFSIPKRFLTWQTVASIFIFALVYGVRYNVGTDNMMYIRCYNELIETGKIIRENFEPGYTCIANIFALFDCHYSIFIGFWGATQLFFVYYAMRNNKYLLPFIALFIVLGPIFLTWANLMRQCVAECIFLFSIEFIVAKKFWKYCVCILVSTLIHKSAILLLPFYFILPKLIVPKSKLLLVGGILICTIIGFTTIWQNFIAYIETVISFLDYDNYSSNFKNIVESANNFRAWGPARAGTWILYIMVILIYPTAKKSLNLDKRFDIYFTCFFYGRCFYELFANTSQIFIRPISYFMDFSIIIVPICIYYLYKQRDTLLFMILFIFAYFYTIYWNLKAYVGTGLRDEAVEVYKFFFLQ